MDAYRYQQLAYLIIPIVLGIEFFLCAKEEKKGKEETPLGSYVLDLLGFLFFALIPAIFIFTIGAVESKSFPFQASTLARLDRYGVLFLFFGAWWQVHIIAALRARRMKSGEHPTWYLWGPFLIIGIYISLLILWESPFNMKWGSIIWFVMVFGILKIFKAKARTVERVLWVLSALLFIGENIVFLFLETVV